MKTMENNGEYAVMLENYNKTKMMFEDLKNNFIIGNQSYNTLNTGFQNTAFNNNNFYNRNINLFPTSQNQTSQNSLKNNWPFPHQNPQKSIDILSYFRMQRIPTVTDFNNKMFCRTACFKETVTRCQEKFLVFPNVLTVFLNYGKDAVFDCRVNFGEKLDLSEFCVSDSSPKIYNLCGVIVHLGPSGNSGHYIAYCKHFDDKWYCFNDSIATKCKFEDCFEGNNLPYVLFYVKDGL